MFLPLPFGSTPDSRPATRRRPLRPLLLLLLATAARTPAAGQGWTGLAHSNYGGTHNPYINPASAADSRHGFYLSLGGVGVNFNNNYLQLDLPGPAREFIDGTRDFKVDYLREQGGRGARSASISGELRLPSVLLALGPRQGIAFTNRVRAFGQATNVSENLARLARYGLDEADRLGLADRLSSDNNFSLNAGAYHEFAFSYARTLTANTTHFWKAGAIVKYLLGLGGGYLRNEGTEYQVLDDERVELRQRNLSYGFTNPDFYDQDDFRLSQLYGGQRLGRGFGLDVGVSYEWRPGHEAYQYRMDGRDAPDPARNKYRLRLGLALTDVGAIRYDNARYVRRAQIVGTEPVQLGADDLDGIDGPDDAAPTLERLVGLQPQSPSFRSFLPAALRLTADYHLAGPLYAGLLWTQGVLPASSIGQRSLSSLALTPRVEFRRAELALPVLLANNYRKLQLGAMLRLGPTFIGSDNLGGLFGLTTTTGADLYFGLGLALHRHRPKDQDHD